MAVPLPAVIKQKHMFYFMGKYTISFPHFIPSSLSQQVLAKHVPRASTASGWDSKDWSQVVLPSVTQGQR